MAVVVVDRCYLHLASDLATFIRFYTSGRGDNRTRQGGVQQQASGRLRSIVRRGRARQLAVTAVGISEDELAVLDEWQGELLMLRDHYGNLMFGSYYSLSVTARADLSGYDASFSFLMVTHEVGV